MVATKTKTTTEIPEVAVKISEQMITALKQYQQFSLDAAQTWAKVAATEQIAAKRVDRARCVDGCGRIEETSAHVHDGDAFGAGV